MTNSRPTLQRLAEHHGILARYERTDGSRKETSNATYVALLAAMGIDATHEVDCERQLAELTQHSVTRILESVRVVLQGTHEVGTLAISVPPHRSDALRWTVDVSLEDGSTQNYVGEISDFDGDAHIVIPELRDLPLGYHQLRWQSSCALEARATQRLIVAPNTCYTVQEKIGERRALGLACNLYSVRSKNNWGIGDFGDLRHFIEFAATNGFDFVGINPLHALSESNTDGCPYFPTSRLYRNFLYLEISAIPEFKTCIAAQTLLASDSFRAELAQLQSASWLDYPRIRAQKRSILLLLHQQFLREHHALHTPRAAAYVAYCEREGSNLYAFASHMAQFYSAHEQEKEISFQCYLQFEIDRQLTVLQVHSQTSKLAFGIYQDLALASSPDGSDTQTFASLFAKGAFLGAPPDPFSSTGQEWGIAPISPERLREQGYEYWILLLRQNLKACGLLRIDHILGFVRQFWIPAGMPPSDGAYIRYPEQDLFRILALESKRHQTAIVGEDLGTVPSGLRDTLSSQGILRSQVLYFEKYTESNFLHPAHYARDALATANTHDLAPLAGYWSGRDLEVRHNLGQIADNNEFSDAKRVRDAEREDLTRLFREYHLLGEATPSRDMDIDSQRALVRAVYLFLARTPARLVGVSLDDLAREFDAINIPGLSPSKNHNWRRRMQRTLESLSSDLQIKNLLHELCNAMDS